MSKRLLTDEQHLFFAENNPGRSAAEMADLMNKTFGLALTPYQVKEYKNRYRLPSGTKGGGRYSRLLTPEQESFFYSHNAGTLSQDLADLMNSEFGTSLTAAQIATFRKNHKAPSGRVTQFGHGQKIHKPPKHVRYPGTEKGWFIKGHRPHNWKPVGSERINVDGYIEVKIEEPNVWAFKHRLVYEEAFGPIPEGSLVRFLDGNRLNCSPDNLVLVSKAENAVLTMGHLTSEDPELTKAGVNLARLRVKIKELEE